MKTQSRRAWVKGMALATLGSVAFYDVSADAFTQKPIKISSTADETLNAWIGAIIPESSIPGAVSLGVPHFVKTMLADCYAPATQQSIQTILAKLPTLIDFTKATTTEKETFLMDMAAGKFGNDEKNALSTIKGLTIQGYMSTEYVMVNHLNYQMAPGFWNPCVPIKK